MKILSGNTFHLRSLWYIRTWQETQALCPKDRITEDVMEGSLDGVDQTRPQTDLCFNPPRISDNTSRSLTSGEIITAIRPEKCSVGICLTLSPWGESDSRFGSGRTGLDSSWREVHCRLDCLFFLLMDDGAPQLHDGWQTVRPPLWTLGGLWSGHLRNSTVVCVNCWQSLGQKSVERSGGSRPRSWEITLFQR